MEEKAQKGQEVVDATKAYHIKNIQELIKMTNSQLEDTLYIADDIFLPGQKNIGRCYRSDFMLKTQKEVQELCKDKKMKIYNRNKKYDFFVYNERAKKILPFKKNDYLIYDHGYFTYDGTNYFSYDDNGNEIGRFSFSNEIEHKNTVIWEKTEMKKKATRTRKRK